MNEKNMDQEIIAPETPPKGSAQGFSPFGSFVAAAGATLLMLCFLGSAMVATVWAFAKLIGVPDLAMYAVLALGVIPVVWATVWTAGRAWHVERLLASGKDIDVPVFNLSYYFKKH
jgi:hypothetical protein